MVDFKYPDPFILDMIVDDSHTDAFGHVNNAVFINWLEQCSWAHADSLGIPLTLNLELRRGMAVRRTEIDYLRAAYVGDHLLIATWFSVNTGLRVVRQYEIRRVSDGALIVVAMVEFVCINLDTGAPSRMPKVFVDGFKVHPAFIIASEQSPSH